MVLPVPIMAHTPAVGQLSDSTWMNSSSLMAPTLTFPMPSFMSHITHSLPKNFPGTMGPAGKNMEGRFIRAAAISMAAGDLSQEAKNTAPSKRSMWPPIIVSISAAMSSRLGRT
jgi:hypothetical protein